MRRKNQKFKKYPIGYFHVYITEVRTKEGKLYLFIAIDRTSKFAYVELFKKQGKIQAIQFLRNLIEKVPHKILTDNGAQFAPWNRKAQYIFDQVCEENGIEHRLTLPRHPGTNGQVKRMNRTIRETAVYQYYYDSRTQLQEHLQAFIVAYAKKLKAIKDLTPREFIIKKWKSNPKSFTIKRDPLNMGLDTKTNPQKDTYLFI